MYGKRVALVERGPEWDADGVRRGAGPNADQGGDERAVDSAGVSAASSKMLAGAGASSAFLPLPKREYRSCIWGSF